MHNALAVGLCLEEEALPAPADPLPPPDSPTHSPSFVRNIMHRPVPPRPFVAHVKYDASAASIAAAFRLPEPHVQALWLPTPPSAASPHRTPFAAPAAQPSPSAAPHHRHQHTRQTHTHRRAHARFPDSPHKRAFTSRFTPQSVQDAAMQQHHPAPATTTAPPPHPVAPSQSARAALSDARRKARRAGLSSQYASLFAAAGTADERVLHFASALAGRLRTLVQPRSPGASDGACHLDADGPDAPPASAVAPDDDDATASPRPVRPAPPRCGLSELRAHPDLALLCRRRAACKERAGLYRCACSEAGVARSGVTGWRYFEVVVADDGGAGGVCVGVGTLDVPLNKMVGGDRRSVALHSSGQVVRAAGTFEPHGAAFGAGDRVGCAVRESATVAGVEIVFFVNGERQGESPIVEPIWDGLDDAECMAFAAMSLYKKDSKIVLVCCAGEWTVQEETLRSTLGDEIWSICGGSGESSSSSSEAEDDLFMDDSEQ